MAILKEELLAKISTAIARVYGDSGYRPQDRGIVPLYKLISDAYSITIAEESNLTYRKASAFIARESGQYIDTKNLDNDKLAGFLYVYEYEDLLYGCIIVEKNDPVTRRRFSAAHELGHYILHFMPLLESQRQQSQREAIIFSEYLTYSQENEATDTPMGQISLSTGELPNNEPTLAALQQMEREANIFAAELLMPSAACFNLAEDFLTKFRVQRPVMARRLATEFLVSHEAMKWRLRSLGLLDK
jgi:Zn-dependent peptidase ImmA (M78 family)